eukprot:5853738-Amphidinium_carterae.1
MCVAFESSSIKSSPIPDITCNLWSWGSGRLVAGVRHDILPIFYKKELPNVKETAEAESWEIEQTVTLKESPTYGIRTIQRGVIPPSTRPTVHLAEDLHMLPVQSVGAKRTFCAFCLEGTNALERSFDSIVHVMVL